MRALHRAFGKQHAVVGDDADGVAVHVAKPQTSVVAVARLELVEPRAVDDARDHLADVEGLARIGGDDAVQLLGIVERLFGRRQSISSAWLCAG
jgi:hypothetical protein